MVHSRFRNKPGSTRALTLTEVMVATLVLGLVVVGSLQVLIQTRKITEGSIYQNAAITVVQGYMEQIKEAKFTNMPYYKDGNLVAGNTDDPIPGLDNAQRSKAIKTYLNNTDADDEGESTVDYLLISEGNPLLPANITPGGATPNGIEDNFKLIDVNQTLETNDDLRLRLWIWVQDISAPAADATQVRSIKVVYQWKMNANPSSRWFVGSMSTMRSSVPTL